MGFPEAVCIGASIALSGICYYLYKKSQAIVDKLDNAPQFPIDGKLKDILKVTPGGCLQYVVIEGAVEPVEEPLMSHFNRETVGVLQRFILREHKLVWNGISRTWMDNDRVVHKRENVVPFLLVGSDKAAVKVLCPLQASGVHTEVTHEKFHPADYHFFDVVGQYLTGEKLKGRLEIEEMLKVGTTLTGVGELAVDTDGTLSLRPPSNGSEYFLSMVDFVTLRGEKENTAFCWRALAVASVLTGAAILFWVGLRYYRHRQVRWEQEQERREFDRQLANDAHQDGANGQPNNVCVICLSQPRNCVLLDCAHVCCCYTCYQALPQRVCPICRGNINRVLPLYHV